MMYRIQDKIQDVGYRKRSIMQDTGKILDVGYRTRSLKQYIQDTIQNVRYRRQGKQILYATSPHLHYTIYNRQNLKRIELLPGIMCVPHICKTLSCPKIRLACCVPFFIPRWRGQSNMMIVTLVLQPNTITAGAQISSLCMRTNQLTEHA